MIVTIFTKLVSYTNLSTKKDLVKSLIQKNLLYMIKIKLSTEKIGIN